MEVSVSILDCSDRIEGVRQLNTTNTSYIHIDVMDGEFVANVQFQDIDEIKEISRVSKYPLDVHLMVSDPISYIEKLNNLNINFISIHLEIEEDAHEIIKRIHELGYQAGISIKPNTRIEKLEEYLEEVDMVLVMSVEPGLGGQKFLPETVDRVNQLKEMIQRLNRRIWIEVDGGINEQIISQLQNVDIVVVGSYVVKSDNYSQQIDNILKNRTPSNINEMTISNRRNSLENIFLIGLFLGGLTLFLLIFLV